MCMLGDLEDTVFLKKEDAVIGYRCWLIRKYYDDFLITSRYHKSHIWYHGRIRARGVGNPIYGFKYSIAEEDQEYGIITYRGIHAYNDPNNYELRYETRPNVVIGSVKLYGKVLFLTKGYIAQYGEANDIIRVESEHRKEIEYVFHNIQSQAQDSVGLPNRYAAL